MRSHLIFSIMLVAVFFCGHAVLLAENEPDVPVKELPATGSDTEAKAENTEKEKKSGEAKGSGAERGEKKTDDGGDEAEKPGESDAKEPETPSEPEHSEEAKLLKQLQAAMHGPEEGVSAKEVEARLRGIVADGRKLEGMTSPGPLKLQATSLQMQALYALLIRFPNDEGLARTLGEIRTTARRTKTFQTPNAKAVGNFWLMTTELYEINESGIALEEKRKQCVETMRGYLANHPDGEPAMDVKMALHALASGDGRTSPEEMKGKPEEDAPKDKNVGGPGEPLANLPKLEVGYELRGPKTDNQGVIHYQVSTPIQSSAVELRVILPERMQEDLKYPVIYMLPVEAKLNQQYGNPVRPALRHDLANKHKVILVIPSFADLPWYADHPSDAQLKQETYFTRVVVPLVDHLYPVDKSRRLLLGYSKSGNGALSLLLRHPETFAASVAWDAPLMEARPVKYGMKQVFATQKNYDQYRIPALLKKQALMLSTQKPRIAILGFDNFRQHVQAAHELMDELKIPHHYEDGPPRRHHWDGGWVKDAVEALVEMKL